MQTETKQGMFGYGALGGILPTIAGLASTYVSAPTTPLPEFGLFLGVALWAIVGGVVALTNTSYEVKQAIFAGIAAPAILMNIVAGATDRTARRSVGLFELSAYAQAADSTTDAQNGAANWAVIVSPSVRGGVPKAASLPVTADVERADGTETIKLGEIRDLDAMTTFVVPQGTSTVYVSGQPISTTGTVTKIDLSVTTTPSFGGDLLWALGAPRSYSIRQLDVSQGTQGDVD